MKILMIIAQRDFRDEEFLEPYNYFKSQDAVVDVASKEVGDCIGVKGAQVPADRSLKDVSVQEYFAIVFVGGAGAKTFFKDPEVTRIINEALKQDIVVAAICIAPLILAYNGVLNGKNATVWNADGNQQTKIEEAGGTFVDENVVTDGKIVTANGPMAARLFGEEVLKVAICEDCWKR